MKADQVLSTWVSLTQSVEGLSRLKELWLPQLAREFSSLLPFWASSATSAPPGLQQTAQTNCSISSWISYLPTHLTHIGLASLHKHRFPVTQQFPEIHILLVLFLRGNCGRVIELEIRKEPLNPLSH